MLDLIDLMRRPPVIRRADPEGEVLQTEPDETIRLPHPEMAWDSAAIELHRFGELWAWSTSVCTSSGGWTYRVAEKWGQYAWTRDDALYWATQEIIKRLTRHANPSGDAKAITKWAEGLT
jgi:hypothetical protein